MNVLTGVLRKDIRKIKDHFSQIYAGLANLFVAAGYHVSYDGTGIHVWDPDRKNPGQLEGLVASTDLFIGEIYGLIFNQYPVKGEKGVVLTLRFPKKGDHIRRVSPRFSFTLIGTVIGHCAAGKHKTCPIRAEGIRCTCPCHRRKK